MSASPLPSEVQFASFLVYNPSLKRFPGAVSAQSRKVCRALKGETATWSRRHNLASRLRDEAGEEIRETFLPGSGLLVPMPGHAPMRDGSTRWPARELCKLFVEAELGIRWLPLLERRVRVSKSATAVPADRPTAQQHYASLEVDQQLVGESSIIVVDDVVTRGSSLLAAVARIREMYPGRQVRGFAVIRTISDYAIQQVKEPCSGIIRLTPHGTHREP